MTTISPDQEERLLKIINDTRLIFNNIEWNMGGIIAAAVLISNPKLLFLNNVPTEIVVDGLTLDGFQSLGISLLEKDRKPRADELIAAVKRSLLCESLEIGADSLARAVRIIQIGIDPYGSDDYFSVDIKELWNSNEGKAGSLIDNGDRIFFEKCVAPLRNIIRHNNGVLPPRKEIIYSGKPKEKQINISFRWINGADNSIKLPLLIAYNIFHTIRLAVLEGLNKGIEFLTKKL